MYSQEEGAAPATAESIWASAVAWRHVIATNLDAELPWVTHLFASRVLAAQLLDPAHTLPRKDGTLLVSSWGKEVIQRQYDDPQVWAGCGHHIVIVCPCVEVCPSLFSLADWGVPACALRAASSQRRGGVLCGLCGDVCGGEADIHAVRPGD